MNVRAGETQNSVISASVVLRGRNAWAWKRASLFAMHAQSPSRNTFLPHANPCSALEWTLVGRCRCYLRPFSIENRLSQKVYSGHTTKTRPWLTKTLQTRPVNRASGSTDRNEIDSKAVLNARSSEVFLLVNNIACIRIRETEMKSFFYTTA